MIDCENEVYTRVAQALRTAHPGINVAGDYVNAPSGFPHVSIIQSDSKTVKEFTDEDEMIQVVFDVDIYSNAKTGKKTEAKKISKTVSDAFFAMNFRRLSLIPVPNRDDPDIYRLTASFEAWTDGINFYRS